MKEVANRPNNAGLTLSGHLARQVVIAIVVNLFIIAITAVSIYQGKQHYDKDISSSSLNLARSLGNNIEDLIRKIDVALYAVATEAQRQLHGGKINREGMNAYLAQIQEHVRELDVFYVADARGNILYGKKISAMKSVNIADRDYFKRLRDNPREELFISKPHIGRISGKWSLYFARRINHPDGSFAGVAFGTLFIDQLVKLFSSYEIGAHGAIGIRDEDATLIAVYPPSPGVANQPGSNVVTEYTRRLVRSGSDSGTFLQVYKRDNILRSMSYKRVGTKFYMIVGLAPTDYLENWRNESMVSAGLAGLFCLLSMWATWLSYQRRKGELEVMENIRLRNNTLEEMVVSREKEAQRTRVLLELHERAPILSDADLYDVIIDKAVQLTGSEIGFICGIEDGGNSITVTAWNARALETCSAAVVDTHYPLSKAGSWLDGLRENRPVVYNDFPNSPNRKGLPEGHVTIRRFVSFPVYSGGIPCYVIGVGNKAEPYDDNDVAQIQLLANELQKIIFNKQADKSLRQSEKQLREAQRIAALGSWELDLRTEDLSWSDEVFRIFEIDREKSGASYKAFLDLVHPDDLETVDNVYNNSLQTGSPHELVHRLLMKDGRTKYVKEQFETENNEDGKPVRFVGTIQDITDIRRMEEQLHQSQKIESIGRLAGGVAHDFNNMLGVILGAAQLLLSKVPEGSDLHQNLEAIQKAAERSCGITRQLLAFSRKEIIAPKPVNLNDLVSDSLKNLGRLIGEDVKLTFKPGDGIWTVLIDPSQLEQIVMNLAINARDAMPDGGLLTIETVNICIDADYSHYHLDAEPGDFVLLTVSDTGCGMDRKTREHIFEPFFTTKDIGKGTGLGLATVYGIVNQNAGFVNCYSEPGQGTTFKIYLPRLMGEIAQKEEMAQPLPFAGAGTILLVEDEAMLLSTITKMLEDCGYTVVQTALPKDAIAICERDQTIDLVLTDLVMPDMNGKVMMERIKEARPDIRFLFMSGYTADIVAQRGIVEEGTPFIQKPLEMKQLNQKIRELLAS